MTKYAGTARDGTRILKQAGKPTHFTRRQLRIAVRRVKLLADITDENRHAEVKT